MVPTKSHYFPKPRGEGGRLDEDWKALGSCRDSDPEAWYPSQTEVVEIRRAIAICGQCPVQAQCLVYAITRDEQFGIWGGVFMEDRVQRRRLGI